MKKLIFSLAVFGLAAASAASSYNVKIFQPVRVGSDELQPGEYRLELKDNTATLKGVKKTVNIPVHVESTDTKYKATSLRLGNDSTLKEIRLSGTTTKIVVNEFKTDSPANGTR